MSTSRRSPERCYQQALVRHEKDLARAASAFALRLCDADTAMALGLPTELPETTRVILAQVHAASSLGPQRPKRSDYEVPDREESPWVP